jgi:hypothetical protein
MVNDGGDIVEKLIRTLFVIGFIVIMVLIMNHYLFSDSVTHDMKATIEEIEGNEAIVKINSETEPEPTYYATAYNCNDWDLAKVGDGVFIKIYDKGMFPKMLDSITTLGQGQQEKVGIVSLDIGFFEKWRRKD